MWLGRRWCQRSSVTAFRICLTGAFQQSFFDGLWIEEQFSTGLETWDAPGFGLGLEPSDRQAEPLETAGQVAKCEEFVFHALIVKGTVCAKCVAFVIL